MAVQDKWFIKGKFKAIETEMEERLQLIGELVSSKARKNAPKVTGTLRNSLTFEVDKKENLVRIGTNVKYAPFVELGTKKIAPRFFLTQAYNESISKIKRIFSKKINRVT